MKQYSVRGMRCAACSTAVEKAVSKVDGVKSCTVNLITNSMGVEGNVSTEKIVNAVKKAGYDASPIDNSHFDSPVGKNTLADSETSVIKRRLVLSLVFLIPLMYLSMGHTMWSLPLPNVLSKNTIAIALLQLLLTFVILVINRNFFISGFKGLINKSPNMDTLVSLGSGAAFVYSTFSLFKMTTLDGDIAALQQGLHDLYFESAGMILTLITVGKMLESRSRGKTTDALKKLLSLAPKTATVIRGGEEILVPIEQVKLGDIFIVKPGESIAVDGVVLEGSSAVDESSLTGESIPIDKMSGDSVSAATINQSGFLKCEAVRVGEDTAFAQIIKTVSEAAATKAPIAKIADRVSGIFVPIVITISLITLVAWALLGQTLGYSLSRAISVLVISCPCALGLATPVAITVGNGLGAKNGILFKTAVSLENAGRVNTVVLDKTGTITEGLPRVTDIIPFGNIPEIDLLKYALSLEKNSEHPLARAIVTKCEEEKIQPFKVVDFKVLTGNGLEALLEGEKLVGGNFNFISSFVKIDDEIKTKADLLSKIGKTPLYFVLGSNLLGLIAVADTIKSDSPEAVRQLQNMGIRVVMLTGDNHRTAKAIGKVAGVDEVFAEVLPDEKEKLIQKFQKEGRVAMVGDGINDAPALTRADIGIAIGAGTDIAIDAADVVLMRSTLSDVPAAIRLSNTTLKCIRQNLFWAFFYNTIGIPVAAGVLSGLGFLLNPMISAAAMSLSSFFVVTNALRINLVDIHGTKHDFPHKRIRKNENKKPKREKITMEKTLKIEGIMCEHCEMRVKKALEAMTEVDNAVVSHKTGTAVVTLNSDVSDNVFRSVIEAEGYKLL